MFYLIYWNHETDQRISARFPKQEDMEAFKELLPDREFIETGPISYWFMSHGFPKLAMMSFWD